MKYLTLSLIFAVLLSVVGLGWIFSQLYYKLDQENSSRDKKFYAYEQVGEHLLQLIKQKESPEVLVQTWNREKGIQIGIQPLEFYPLPSKLLSDFKSGQILYLNSEKEFTLNFYIDTSDSVLTIYLSPELVEESMPWLSLFLTLGFYFSLIIIILAWLYPLIRRLSVVRKTAREFGEGRLSSRVGESRITYIADIENEFNGMADRIQSLLSDNKLLSRAVSHDLKTPLARLRFGIDALSEMLESERQQKYIERIQDDLTEMESLVETLLNYARLDESYVDLSLEPIELGLFIKNVFKKDLLDDERMEIEVNGRTFHVSGDKSYLSMMFKNLLSNSRKFASQKVKVTIFSNKKYVFVSFEDDGPGFSKDAIESALQPFWRDNIERAVKGHGMGLAIVDRIAKWHKAQVLLSNSEKYGGAKIRVRFDL